MEKHALLIGINDYPKVRGADLRGCLADVELMRSQLVERFGFAADRTRSLCNAEATRDRILSALEELVAAVREDDLVVLFYAGHGSRIADPRRPGRMIESIVPYDSGRGEHPNRDVLDEEIDRWVQRINKTTPFVTLIFDCCHSGSVTRDAFGGATREVPPDRRSPERMFPPGEEPEILTDSRAEDEDEDLASGWLPGRRQAVLVAACRADEYAVEHRYVAEGDVVRHGALTFFLARALIAAESGSTWRDVFERVAPEVTSRYRRQRPQLEGKADEVLFGTEEIRPASYLRVTSVDGETVKIAGGAAHGVAPGSLWTIRPHGARHRAFGEEAARVRITSVATASSDGRIERGDPGRLAAGQRAFLFEQPFKAGLGVAVSTSGTTGEEHGELVASIAGSNLLELVEEDRAEVLVRCFPACRSVEPGEPCPGLGPLRERTWVAVGSDGLLAVRQRKAGPEAPKLIGDLERLARYRGLLALENPDPACSLRGSIRLQVRRWVPADRTFVAAEPHSAGWITFHEGEKADFEIRNDGETPVWFSLLELDCDGSIGLFAPWPDHPTYRPGHGISLAPQEVWKAREYFLQVPGLDVREGLPQSLPRSFPGWSAEEAAESCGTAYLKLLVTAEDTGFEIVEQCAVRDSRPGCEDHPLRQLTWLQASGRGTRVFGPRPVDDAPWTTVTVALTIFR